MVKIFLELNRLLVVIVEHVLLGLLRLLRVLAGFFLILLLLALALHASNRGSRRKRRRKRERRSTTEVHVDLLEAASAASGKKKQKRKKAKKIKPPADFDGFSNPVWVNEGDFVIRLRKADGTAMFDRQQCESWSVCYRLILS